MEKNERRICTLTGKEDRKEGEKTQIDKDAPCLTEEETKSAVQVLVDNSFLEKCPFPKLEKRYLDPPVEGQRIGIFSFIPALGATPNEKGIFGYGKIRGCFPDKDSADKRAEFIIKNVDSYHVLHYPVVGFPFPITTSTEFCEELGEVEIKKDMKESFSAEVKRVREKDQKEIEEIQQKEKNLLEDVKRPEKENKDDYYTTLHTKKAQLTWTYVENMKKLKQMCILVAKARKEIEDMDKEDPNLRKTYLQRYMKAREEAGIPTTRQFTEESFMKYLVEDVKIPEFDREYEKLYGADSEEKS